VSFPQPQRHHSLTIRSELDRQAIMVLPEEDAEVFKRWVLPKLETM
jgi:hypothetical protein